MTPSEWVLLLILGMWAITGAVVFMDVEAYLWDEGASFDTWLHAAIFVAACGPLVWTYWAVRFVGMSMLSCTVGIARGFKKWAKRS